MAAQASALSPPIHENVLDLTVGDLVNLRLIGASQRDAGIVRRQVGATKGSSNGSPDIVIEFVERIAKDAKLRYLGLNGAAFTDHEYLLLQSKNNGLKTELRFDQLGGAFVIRCESGGSTVPLLTAVINMTLLAKGTLPVHASAFVYKGIGVLVTGWAGGGKTEALLAFMSHGAIYVGDDWVYIDADGRRLRGDMSPIRLRRWHLDALPHYRHAVDRRRRVRFAALESARRALSSAGSLSKNARVTSLSRLIDRQQFVQVRPDRLFGAESCGLEGSFDKLFLVLSHASPEVQIRRADPIEIARRLAFSSQYERRNLLLAYLQFRFAFPDRASSVMDQSEMLERELLTRVFENKDAYSVFHPTPTSLQHLFNRMQPFVAS